MASEQSLSNLSGKRFAISCSLSFQSVADTVCALGAVRSLSPIGAVNTTIA